MVRRLGRGQANWDLIRQKRPRIHARSWRFKTSYDTQGLLENRAQQGLRGSLEERIFYKALAEHGFIPGVDFTFQSSMMGGRGELGGLVADFLFPVPMVIVNPMSYWHTISLAHERRDDDQVMILRSLGYTLLEVWPITIHDQFALDRWISDNLMLLWGTSTGSSGAGTVSFLESIQLDALNRVNLTLDAILKEL